jgi:hypothetical protein
MFYNMPLLHDIRIMDNRMKIDKDKNKKPAIFLYGRLAIG